MSQVKNTRSKRKQQLPCEIVVSLKTPKSRQHLFSSDSISSSTQGYESGDSTAHLKRSKRKKLRKTQNGLEPSPIFTKGQKTSSRSSVASQVDGDVSSEVFVELEDEKPKTKKSKKKKIKLPVVNLDDFGSIDNSGQFSQEEMTFKKNSSIESISSSITETSKRTSGKKKKKKATSKKHEKSPALDVSNSTTKRKRTLKSEITEESEQNVELAKNSRRRKTRIEITEETEELQENSTSTVKTRRKKKSRETEENNETDNLNVENTKSLRKSKRTTKLELPQEINNDAPLENTRNSKKARKTRQKAIEENEAEEEKREDFQEENMKSPGQKRKNGELEDVENSINEKIVDVENRRNVKKSLKKSPRRSSSIHKSEEISEKHNLSVENTSNMRKSKRSNGDIPEENTCNSSLGTSKSPKKSKGETLGETVEKFLDENFKSARPSWKEILAFQNGTLDNGTVRQYFENSSSSEQTDAKSPGSKKIVKKSIGKSPARSSSIQAKKLEPEVEFNKSASTRKSWQIPEIFEHNEIKKTRLFASKSSDECTESENVKEGQVQNKKSPRKTERNSNKTERISETEISLLDVTRLSRGSKRVSSLNVVNNSPKIEESRRLSVAHSRTPRKSRTELTPKATPEVATNVERSQGRRTSRKSWQKVDADSDVVKRLELGFDVLKQDQASDSGSSNEVVQNDTLKLNSSQKDVLKTPISARKTPAEENKRKRWTLLNEVDQEEMSTSRVVNKSRRSTRKRWSTELKRRTLDSSQFAIKEIITTAPESPVSKKESSRVEQENHSETSPARKTSRKSNVSVNQSAHNNSTFVQNKSARDSTHHNSTFIQVNYDHESTHQNSTFVQNKSACDKTQGRNSTFTKIENVDETNKTYSLRDSRRQSKSLDLQGISLLEQSGTYENGEADLEKRSPGSILKRRGTYEVDVSVTDVSILKSVSEGNVSQTGLDLEGIPEDTGKTVKFQYVTRRKPGPALERESSSPKVMQAPIIKKLPHKLTAANKSVSFDQTIFSASSCSTSTPLHPLKKTTLLKQTLKNNIQRRSRSVEERREKPVSRIKMPNFSKIHQRWNDKFEDINQLVARKAERARLLLSGQKPTSSTSMTNESQKKNDTGKHPRQLNFGKNQSANPPTPRKETPKKTKVQENIKKKAAIDNKKLVLHGILEAASSKNLKSGIPKKLETVKSTDMLLKRTEEIRSVATKSKPKHDAKEERRTILKGVRGNRRFELLMKMRNK